MAAQNRYANTRTFIKGCNITALFAVLGTTYGGNGTTNFMLPDLRGRVAVNAGQAPGLSNYVLGEQTGSEAVTLNITQMPSHGHNVSVNTANGNQTAPSNNFLAQSAGNKGAAASDIYNNTAPGGGTYLAATTIQPNGGSQPHTNIQPTLALNYIIALVGIYPARN